MKEDAIVGCLLGAAIGDALGLPYEGLSRRRAARLLGPPDRFRLSGSRGFVSDDTEHLCLVAQSLIAAGNDDQKFDQEMARRLRRWFLSLSAGIGMATLKSCLKLCIGFPPSKSGVRSAGNGAAMRASIIGACFDDPGRCLEIVERSSRITHIDVRAIDGAKAVALAAILSSRQTISAAQLPEAFMAETLPVLGNDSAQVFRSAAESVQSGESTERFAASLGSVRLVSGYVLTSVPVAIHAWLTSPEDHLRAVKSVIALGGDTDTMAAITGGLVGCRVRERGLSADLLAQLRDLPRSVEWMKSLGLQLASGERACPIELSFLTLLARNAMFTAIVLGHGLRRLAPPY